MTKREFVEKLMQYTGKSKNESMYWTNAVLDGIVRAVAENESGDHLKFPKFITFWKEHRPPKKYRNPRTGEYVDSPDKYMFKAKVSKKTHEMMIPDNETI